MKNPRSFTRREWLRLGGLGLIVHAISDTTFAADPDTFEFIVVNDTHYLDEQCGEWLGPVIAAMRASAPRAAFCLHAGDFTDRGSAEACAAAAKLFAELGCPFHPVPGNHDFIAHGDRSGYDAIFPGRLNYRFDHGGWHFLGLDTTEGTNFIETEIGTDTFAWLEAETARLNPRQPVFAFTHFPLGEGIEMRPRNAEALIARLAKLRLRWVHSGHWHGESVRRADGIPLTTSRCCARIRDNRDGSPLKGWHIYRAAPDGTLARRFVAAPQRR